ncbi:hypothetical protein XM47_01720 [Catenovulum maritimum]|uniref:Uncharacterized protein n=1 Tax=Catenovulum maritimum TaxID=1513271 RepID=A0A0J8JQ60_9ALTE|nr:hypothetical protein XM47_01720 [Catenovulum maritimum]
MTFFYRNAANTPESTEPQANVLNTEQIFESHSQQITLQQAKLQSSNVDDCKNERSKLDSPEQIKICIDLLLVERPLLIDELLRLYSAWAVFDLAKALEQLVLLPPEVSNYLIYDVIRGASGNNLHLILSWLESQSFEYNVKSDLIVSAYVGASIDNPISILSLAENVTNPQLKNQVIDSILTNWAEQDYAAVLAWVESRERPEMYHYVKKKLLLNMIEEKPSEALYYLELMPQNPDKTQLIERYAHVSAEVDLSSTLEWARTLEVQTERVTALSAILDLAVSQSQDYQFAWELALTENNSSAQQQILTHVAQNIVNQDIAWIVERFDSIPESTQADIAKIIMQKWLELDEEAAIEWANSLSSPESRNGIKQNLF